MHTHKERSRGRERLVEFFKQPVNALFFRCQEKPLIEEHDPLHLSISWLRFYFLDLKVYELPPHLNF